MAAGSGGDWIFFLLPIAINVYTCVKHTTDQSTADSMQVSLRISYETECSILPALGLREQFHHLLMTPLKINILLLMELGKLKFNIWSKNGRVVCPSRCSQTTRLLSVLQHPGSLDKMTRPPSYVLWPYNPEVFEILSR